MLAELNVAKMGPLKKLRISFGGDKVAFFGPSGGGKSLALAGLAAVVFQAARLDGLRELDVRPLAVSASIDGGVYTLYIDDEERLVLKAEVNGKQYVDVLSGDRYIDDIGGEPPPKAPLAGASYVDICHAHVAAPEYAAYDICRGQFTVDSPGVGRWLSMHVHVIGGDDFYYDSVFIDGEWVKISQLPLGKRRALGIIMAAHGVDAVFIDAFEAGLHQDVAAALIKWLAEQKRFVAVELHTAAAAKAALEAGWEVYYFDGGAVRRLETI